MTILIPAGKKLLQIGAFTALSTLAMQGAHAGPIDSYLISGVNNIQDVSGEVVYRCTETISGTDCVRRSLGEAIALPSVDDATGFETFDVFAGVLDFGQINGQTVSNDSNQLTALFAVKVDALTEAFSGGSAVEFGGAGEAAWDDIFGAGSMGGFALDQGSNDDVIAALYQHNALTIAPAMDDPGGTFTASIAAANDGTLAAVTGILDGSDDFFESTYTTFPCNAFIVGGGANCTDATTIYGIKYAMSFFQYELAGDYVSDSQTTVSFTNPAFVEADLIGTGDLTTPLTQGVQGTDAQNPDGFHYGDNINGLFVRVPEPATLGLLGMSLIGFASLARRRRAS